MLDLVFRALGWVLSHPLVWPALGAIWLLGLGRGTRRTPAAIRSRWGAGIGNAILGVLAIVGLTTWIYKNRRQAGRAMLCVIVAAGLIAWAVAITLSPRGWAPVIVVGSCVALAIALFPAGIITDTHPGGPVYRMIGNRSLDDWFASRWLGQRVEHAAGQVLEGVVIHETKTAEDGTITARAQLPAGGMVEHLQPGAIESALAKDGIAGFHHVEVAPAGKPGEVKMTIAMAPSKTAWEILRAVDNRWPGAKSDDPAAPIPLGPCVNTDGTVGTLELPGDAVNLLIGGSTRAGKTVLMATWLSTLAYRQHTQFVLFDPGWVEFRPWEPRAVKVAKGQVACYWAAKWTMQQLDERQRHMDERGIRHWRVGIDGPRIEVVIDEAADLTMEGSWDELPTFIDDNGDTVTVKRADAVAACRAVIRRMAQLGAKYGFRLTLATQRPENNAVPVNARDQFHYRVGLAHESLTTSVMTLGEGSPDTTEIPLWLRGGAYARIDRGLFVPMRSFIPLPRGACDDPHEVVTVAAEEIASATARLRDSRLIYPQATKEA